LGIIAYYLEITQSYIGFIASDIDFIASDSHFIASDSELIASYIGFIASDNGFIGFDIGFCASLSRKSLPDTKKCFLHVILGFKTTFSSNIDHINSFSKRKGQGGRVSH